MAGKSAKALEQEKEESREAKEPQEPQKTKRKLPPALEAYKWKPGQSGNPSGKAKGSAKAKSYIDEHALEAAKALVEILQSQKEETKFRAAVDILDRNLGKAVKQNEREQEGEGAVVVCLSGELRELSE